MAKFFSLGLLLASIWITGHLVQGSLRSEGRFLTRCQPEARKDAAYCPKSTKFLIEFLGWGWPSVSTEDLIGRTVLAEMFSPYCQLHQMIVTYLYVILTVIFGYGIFLMKIF